MLGMWTSVDGKYNHLRVDIYRAGKEDYCGRLYYSEQLGKNPAQTRPLRLSTLDNNEWV
jgi:hypothetical protein